MTLVILLVLALGLFALAYVTKRRFGVLGLALAAGALLSSEITRDTANFLQYLDIPVEPLSFMSAAHVLLVLTPAFVLLFAGPKYHGAKAALLGSAAFAVFGTILLLAPLSRDLPLQDPVVLPFLNAMAANSSLIITICTALAVLDMFHIHSASPLGKKSKRH
jgi:hypothetical protein